MWTRQRHVGVELGLIWVHLKADKQSPKRLIIINLARGLHYHAKGLASSIVLITGWLTSPNCKGGKIGNKDGMGSELASRKGTSGLRIIWTGRWTQSGKNTTVLLCPCVALGWEGWKGKSLVSALYEPMNTGKAAKRKANAIPGRVNTSSVQGREVMSPLFSEGRASRGGSSPFHSES